MCLCAFKKTTLRDRLSDFEVGLILIRKPRFSTKNVRKNPVILNRLIRKVVAAGGIILREECQG